MDSGCWQMQPHLAAASVEDADPPMSFIISTGLLASMIANASELLTVEADLPGSANIDADTHVLLALGTNLPASRDGDTDFHVRTDGHHGHPGRTEGNEAEKD